MNNSAETKKEESKNDEEENITVDQNKNDQISESKN